MATPQLADQAHHTAEMRTGSAAAARRAAILPCGMVGSGGDGPEGNGTVAVGSGCGVVRARVTVVAAAASMSFAHGAGSTARRSYRVGKKISTPISMTHSPQNATRVFIAHPSRR